MEKHDSSPPSAFLFYFKPNSILLCGSDSANTGFILHLIGTNFFQLKLEVILHGSNLIRFCGTTYVCSTETMPN